MPKRRRRRTVSRVAGITTLLLIGGLVLLGAFFYAFDRVWSNAHPASPAPLRLTNDATPAPGSEDFTAGERRGLDDILKRRAAQARP